MKKKVWILSQRDLNLLLIALCNYKYDWCVPGSKRYKQVDKFLDKFFEEEDYLLND